MRFTKAHGTGNDFVVVDDWDDVLDLDDDLVRALCDRRLGVGADGVLRLVATPDGDVLMDHRNADGSRPEMCGNGVRVVAKHVVDHGRVAADDDRVRVVTRAGVKEIEVVRGPDGRVTDATVDMGPPQLDPAEIPFDAPDGERVPATIEVAGDRVDVVAVSMGNPHAVLVVASVADAPVATLGPAIERHERFPKGTNVEFVEPLDDGRARVRVWERGVGETAACGTGACAVLVALQELGRAGDELVLAFPGGEVTVRRERGSGPVQLTGGAVEVASGELDTAWMRAARDRGRR